ncbi:MAG: glycerol-3-phosphate dehydrogenase C-terminal domain-containing protein, partial [Limisphaerales bacterium]
AEQTVDQIVKLLQPISKMSNREIVSCRTAKEPLLPRAETENVSGILPPPFNREVVKHFCENEWAVHLDDVMVRRTSWHYYFADADVRAEQVANWMGEFLNWPEKIRAEEIERYHVKTNLATDGHR